MTHKERVNRHPGEIDLEIKRLNELITAQRRVVKATDKKVLNATECEFNEALIENNEAIAKLYKLITLRAEERKMLKAATKHMRSRS